MTPEQIEQHMLEYNKRIEEVERTLAWLQEQRREFINRHNLNKVKQHVN